MEEVVLFHCYVCEVHLTSLFHSRVSLNHCSKHDIQQLFCNTNLS